MEPTNDNQTPTPNAPSTETPTAPAPSTPAPAAQDDKTLKKLEKYKAELELHKSKLEEAKNQLRKQHVMSQLQAAGVTDEKTLKLVMPSVMLEAAQKLNISDTLEISGDIQGIINEVKGAFAPTASSIATSKAQQVTIHPDPIAPTVGGRLRAAIRGAVNRSIGVK